MRIRTVKPKFWRSDDIDVLDWETRLLFIALWSYVDDNGVGVDRLANIAADMFAGDMARDPIDTLAKVSRGLQALSDAGRLMRYIVDGKPYLSIVNFDVHQKIDKPNSPRFPPPDAATSANVVVTPEIATPSRESRETPSSRSIGVLEKELPCSSPTAQSEFDQFWAMYPRKVGKGKASRDFVKARKRAPLDKIIAGATRYATDPNLPAKEFIPYPATWLNADSWDDEPCAPRAAVTPIRGARMESPRIEGQRRAAY